jgi:GDP-L-fucose synthase
MLPNQYKTKNIFIAGHNGMVGRAIHNLLLENNFHNLFTADRQELDLTNYQVVSDFIRENNIEVVVNAAAKVGGIMANSNFPYDFLMQNMQIQNNLIDASVKNNISKFIFLGSSCVYPKYAKQPIKEEYLLTDFLEPTNQWYSIAKISGIYACIAAKKQTGLNTVCLMPTNLYGPHDNFSLESSHVIPAMIRKFSTGKKYAEKVTLWGTGTAMREFLRINLKSWGVR